MTVTTASSQDTGPVREHCLGSGPRDCIGGVAAIDPPSGQPEGGSSADTEPGSFSRMLGSTSKVDVHDFVSRVEDGSRYRQASLSPGQP
eukprot:CAMPEP_0172685398 /NCGR_PEP_ID=MMETSP1074-20121228/20209_1 /TAXON_ID=2916 /ORGANISM="Ceratium fusus, Strain PA161109" /LENGTH=88 /DNA_ID=CAMNT_0013504531 /DNA_START=112 /DNA_END=374 /DNA_ORIENTATION=-